MAAVRPFSIHIDALITTISFAKKFEKDGSLRKAAKLGYKCLISACGIYVSRFFPLLSRRFCYPRILYLHKEHGTITTEQ